MFHFLVAVLGTDGAKALRKASEREPALLSYMLPRAALAWLRDRQEHEGQIPGQENSYLAFQKSEQGIDGTISMPEGNVQLSSKDDLGIAAAISVSLGFPQADFKGRDVTLTRLGKSIDALVRARELSRKIASSKEEESEVKKTDLPGTTAKPNPQLAPVGPELPKKQQGQPPKPKLPKISRTIKVEKSEASQPCPACGGQRFKNDKFVGCLCWVDVSKSISTTAYSDGYALEADSDVDKQTVIALMRDFSHGRP
jgi:hypothetical protein